MLGVEVCPYSYFPWCGYFRGLWVSFLTKDVLSEGLFKDCSVTAYLFDFPISFYFNEMVVLSKGRKPDKFQL